MRSAWMYVMVAVIVTATPVGAQMTRLRVVPPFADPKEAENLSGAACAAGPQGTCLLIGDEKLYARAFTLVGDELKPSQTAKVDLLPTGSDETDAEGIAAWDGVYYLIGSHGLSKKEKLQSSRFHVWRVEADRSTGVPSGSARSSARLRSLLKSQVPFKDWAEAPLRMPNPPNDRAHGVNIEGVAVNADGMFLAFRGPVLSGKAYVLRVKTDAVFTKSDPLDPKVFPIELGAETGLRDIAAIGSGFLLLTGPEADADGVGNILFWNGRDQTAKILAAVKNPTGVKPESLTLLSERPDGIEVLVLSDGVAGGAPVRIRMMLKS